MQPIEIHLRLSPILMTVLCLMHVMALTLLLALALGWTVKLGISALIMLSLALTTRRLLRPEIAALRVNSKGEFSIQRTDGSWLSAVVSGSSYVSASLTILNLRLAEKRMTRHLLLVPDAVEKDAYRKLRVWLRWRAAE